MIKSILKGLGQIMLQNSWITGVIFLVGIAATSYQASCAALMGSTIGTILAVLLSYPHDEIDSGLYGFNAALVAVGCFFFLKLTLITVTFSVVGICLSTILMRVFLKNQLKAYTFPFVVILWLILFLANSFSLEFASPSTIGYFYSPNFPEATLQAFAEVMFQSTSLTGLLFIIAIFINSRLAALAGIFGAMIATIIAILFQWPNNDIFGGIYGFNSVLAAIALCDTPFSWKHSLLGSLIAVCIMKMMMLLGLVTLTAPFVFAAWLVLLIDKKPAWLPNKQVVADA